MLPSHATLRDYALNAFSDSLPRRLKQATFNSPEPQSLFVRLSYQRG
jgi:hypothetical protein